MSTTSLYPYEVSERLSLRLADFDDPTAGVAVAVLEIATARESDGDDQSPGIVGYDATDSGSWRKLTFRLDVELPTDELDRVLPSTSDLATDTSLVVRMTCQGTRYRRGVRLRPSGRGRWSGYATIQRDDVRGSIALRPQLVRVSTIPEGDELPYATRAGALMASGEAISLYVDTQPPASGFLNTSVMMSWEDFANSNDLWRREHPDDLYHLEPFGLEPRLWLNSRYGQLRDVLDSTAKRGRDAVLRDTFGVLIAQPALLQLSLSALAALEIDEDSGAVSEPSGWRSDLLAMLLPRLYPEEPDADERLRRAVSELHEADGSGGLCARLGTAIQGVLGSYKTVEAALRTFESVREEEEVHDV